MHSSAMNEQTVSISLRYSETLAVTDAGADNPLACQSRQPSIAQFKMPGSSSVNVVINSLSCSASVNCPLNGISRIRLQIPSSDPRISGRLLVVSSILPTGVKSTHSPSGWLECPYPEDEDQASNPQGVV